MDEFEADNTFAVTAEVSHYQYYSALVALGPAYFVEWLKAFDEYAGDWDFSRGIVNVAAQIERDAV